MRTLAPPRGDVNSADPALAAAWQNLHDEAGGIIRLMIVRWRDAVLLSAAALAGNEDAQLACAALTGWRHDFSKAIEKPVCLDCDHVFRDKYEPSALLLLLPYGKSNPSTAGTSGICRSCAARTDAELYRAAHERLRAVWPDLRAIEVTTRGGHA